MTSWKCEVLADGSWCSNDLRFATKEEAEAYGRNLLSRWMAPTASRAVPCDREVNYYFSNGQLFRLSAPKESQK